MTKSPHRVLDFYASKSWAILEPALQEMFEIYKAALERKALDTEFDPQAVAAKLGRPLDNARTVTIRDGIAILPVSGPIFRYANLFTEISGATSIEVLATDFHNALEDRAVHAIILEVNSPGGEVDGTSEFAQHIFEARGKKPVVAYISHLGASAAYWIPSACDEIVCADTACLGSIGVVGAARISKDKSMVEFVSSQSPNKRPDPSTEAGKAQLQKHVDDLADVFIRTVARNRGMSAEDVVSKGGAGGILVGQHAVDAGLADRLGTLEGLIAELSQPAHARTQNVNIKTVLQSGADSQTLETGVATMADEKKDTKDTATGIDQVAIDKTIGERVKAFFQETFGGNSTASVTANSDPVAESNRLAVERAQTEAQAAKAEAADAKIRVAHLEKENRATRYGVLAADWPGEPSKHVAMLELLATSQEGAEDSQSFKDYVTQQKAISEQVKTAALFKEIGSSQPVEGSITAVVQGKVKAAQESDPNLTKEQAFDHVWQSMSRADRSQYRDEEKRTIN